MLFYRLSRGEKINKQAFCDQYEVSKRTFDRDINDIRMFLSEIFTSSELVFDHYRNEYYLSDCRAIDEV